MAFAGDLLAWLTDPAHWSGPSGIPARLLEHVYYSVVATLIAAAIALPIGLWVGHTGRGGALAVNLTNVGRAIPSLGIIMLVYLAAGLGVVPVLVALAALALPPIVTNSYVGVRTVPPAVTDSATGLGLTGWQTLRDVEIPVAMPLIMAGIRTSAVQVVATATIAAFIGSGGLGRFIIDGLASQVLSEVVAGALLVAALALVTEYGLAAVQKAVVPEGLRERNRQAAVAAKTR